MPRVSKKQAEQHHQDVVATASKLFRAHGINGVSVPALMAEAGLTHGAFYGHFASKEELAVAACAEAFAEKCKYYDEMAARCGGDVDAARTELVKRYAARSHRDHPGLGCPLAALAADAARDEFKGPVRRAFAAGLKDLVDRVQPLLGRRGKKAQREEALADVALLVGSLVLARATKGQPISEEILEAARKALLDT